MKYSHTINNTNENMIINDMSGRVRRIPASYLVSTAYLFAFLSHSISFPASDSLNLFRSAKLYDVNPLSFFFVYWCAVVLS